jgi:ABC-2 type transport system permease protein
MAHTTEPGGVAESLRVYAALVLASLRSQMQYRASFAMLTVSQVLVTGVEFLAMWALFARFRSLAGWDLPEVALFYGIANVAFAIAESVGRGFDAFSRMVRAGDFDRVLLRPRTTVLQILGHNLRLIYVGRLAQGAAVLAWAAWALGVDWTLARALLLGGAVLGGVCFFMALFVFQATFCFWSTESLEVFSSLTYGGVFAAQYPMAIYRSWFRRFFTYIVPLACLAYYPGLAIMGRATPGRLWLHYLSPLTGVVFLAVSLAAWRFGVRRYRSTGS